MSIKNIDALLENQNLKNEFARRNLDLSQVWNSTPDDLELENRQLLNLLDWVVKYEECQSRAKMEKQGYDFPPISFDIDPDSDWLRFERWIAGKKIKGKLEEQLPENYKPKDPKDLNDDEIYEELQLLNTFLEKRHFSVDYLDKGIPPRLVYEELLDTLGDEFEQLAGGFWHLDGCTGYCPDCFQRPWCESGGDLCWEEDEKAGCMVFPDYLKKYVSPSPVSLEILRKCDEENKIDFNDLNEDSVF